MDRIRIKDIAEELGLSTATVSNVIHGKNSKVSPETIKRVQELIEKREYIPSMAGILLARNNSRIIGVVINRHTKYEGGLFSDNFISNSINGLSVQIEQAGYFMMIKTSTSYEEIIKFASMWNMDGLVIIGFCESDYKKLREGMHIPFVVYDGYFEGTANICNLTIDNFAGGFMMGEYFYKKGHRRVVCLSDNYICMDKERIDGLRKGLGEGKAELLKIPLHKRERLEFYEANFKEITSQYSAAFAVSDEYAIEFMHFLQKKQIRIPEEFSIAGFDGGIIGEKVYPELTSVKQDMGKRAEYAIEALLSLKEGREIKKEIRLPVELAERDSICSISQSANYNNENISIL